MSEQTTAQRLREIAKSPDIKPGWCLSICEAADELDALTRERDRLREALKELFGLVEAGELVRNTDRDSEPGFAIRQLPFIQTLAKVHQALSPDAGKDGEQ